jgi:hypothetical protein
VVDHELDRHQRVDEPRVAAQRLHRVAHGGKVDDRRHAGEVLHQHAARREGDLDRCRSGGIPAGQRLDVLARDRLTVLGAQEILEQDLQRERQPGDIEALLQRVEAEDLQLAPAHAKRVARPEGVWMPIVHQVAPSLFVGHAPPPTSTLGDAGGALYPEVMQSTVGACVLTEPPLTR